MSCSFLFSFFFFLHTLALGCWKHIRCLKIPDSEFGSRNQKKKKKSLKTIMLPGISILESWAREINLRCRCWKWLSVYPGWKLGPWWLGACWALNSHPTNSHLFHLHLEINSFQGLFKIMKKIQSKCLTMGNWLNSLCGGILGIHYKWCLWGHLMI